LQRLFSTFPDGWPGAGLLLLRLGAAIPLAYFGASGLTETIEPSLGTALSLIAIAGGALLLIGLWTPVAGVVAAIGELCGTLSGNIPRHDDHWNSILLAVLSAGVAMIGPGAWSLDARLFGRRRFEIDGRGRL
jgi:uncharacterized membrane protein YphA (DoxX/SURF4 family)